MDVREKTCRFKKNRHAAGIVIGPWGIDHRIKVRADNNTPIACRAGETGNDIVEDLISPGKEVALDGYAIALKFGLNKVSDRCEVPAISERTSLADNCLQIAAEPLAVNAEVHVSISVQVLACAQYCEEGYDESSIQGFVRVAAAPSADWLIHWQPQRNDLPLASGGNC